MKGGLGVIDFKIQNEALLVKHLHKFDNKYDFSWVVHLIWDSYYSNRQVPYLDLGRGSFWWKDILKSLDHFRGTACCFVGSGDTVFLWNDVWSDSLLRDQHPRLFFICKE